MKRLLLAAVVAAGCASRPVSGPAPAFELTAVDGGRVKSEDLWKGKPVLLVFMTSWCRACREEVPELNAIAKKHSVVAIATGDTEEAAKRCLRATGMEYPMLLDDGAVAKVYGVQATPTCVLVDEHGQVKYRGSRPPEELR